MSKPLLAAAALASSSFAFTACAGSAGQSGGGPAPASTAQLSPADLAAAHAAFEQVYEVLQHPRCLNCHPAGDRPLQYDSGRPHAMNVVRGPDDRGMAGMRCSGCHGSSNSTFPHLPPGVASGWRLAPRAMVFEGRSRTQMATQLLDPERTHMDTEQLLAHVAHDPLVLWGWDPGPGREPVPVPHAQFVAAFRTWVEAGAPVPEGGTR